MLASLPVVPFQLSNLPQEEQRARVPTERVAELGAAGLRVQAGQVLLHAHRFHPALHSTAAALTLLRKFVATTTDPEDQLSALRETLAAWQ